MSGEAPRNIFGTDGIRDVGGRGWLAPEELTRLGPAIVALGDERGRPDPTVLIGRDPRESGPAIEAALTETLERHGARVLLAGILPTPGVSTLVADGEADLGIVISASHNPPADNGVKFFGPDGAKLSVEEEERITGRAWATPPRSPGTPETEFDPERSVAFRARYLDRLVADLGPEPFLVGRTVVLDCARGATAVVAAEAFERCGARVHAIHADPDGARINVGCGSTHPGAVSAEVRARGADLGVAFDGDGDRAILVDETGGVVDGDEMLTLWALDLRDRGELPGAAIVVTVMSNAGMENYLRDAGIDVVRTQVGDREVHRAMRERGFILGGEQSGHLIEGGAQTGDGIRTGLAIARIVARAGRPLSELRAPIPRYPQTLVGVPVTRKPAFSTLPVVREAVEAAERALEGHGRVLLRYSGTEPLARILVEGSDAAENEAWAERIAEAVRRGLGSE